MDKIKLGIIGCGIAAKELHLPALKKLDDKFVITAVCNHTEPKAKEFSNLVGGVPYVLDYKELLNNKNVDAVDITLPIHLNYQVTKDALEAGKHVIVEKPIAANISEAKKMLDFPGKYKTKMMVAENFRYRMVFRKIKELIKNGTIGKPYAAMWDVYLFINENSKYASTKWRRHPKYEGAFVNDAGVHNIAALRFLFGEITALSAFSKSINPKIGQPDSISIQFETDENVNGVFNLFFSVNGYWKNQLLILGNKGSIVVEENNITIKKNNEKDYVETIEDDGGYIEEFTEFYNAVKKRKKILSTFDEGVKDLKVILEALRSAETGKKLLIK